MIVTTSHSKYKKAENCICPMLTKKLLPSDKWSGEVMMYNLDVVIAVGYRVNSFEATQFRICATQVLKDFLVVYLVSAE